MSSNPARKHHKNRDPRITTGNTLEKIGKSIAGLALEMRRKDAPNLVDYCKVQWGKEAGETFLEITYHELAPPKETLIAPLGDVHLDLEKGVSTFRVETKEGLMQPDETKSLLKHFSHILRSAGKSVETNPVYRNAQIGISSGEIRR